MAGIYGELVTFLFNFKVKSLEFVPIQKLYETKESTCIFDIIFQYNYLVIFQGFLKSWKFEVVKNRGTHLKLGKETHESYNNSKSFVFLWKH